MARPSDGKKHERAQLVLNFCQQPKTMAEIRAQFGTDWRFRYAVYNLVAAGKLKNLNPRRDDHARYKPGLFVSTEAHGEVPAPANDGGVLLQRVWMGGA